MSQTWSKSCSGRKFLIEQFKLFESSGGDKGIDYKASCELRPKQINEEIYDKYPEQLGNYKRVRFPYNFMDTARAYKVDTQKHNGRRKQSELYYLFCSVAFILLFTSLKSFLFFIIEVLRSAYQSQQHLRRNRRPQEKRTYHLTTR